MHPSLIRFWRFAARQAKGVITAFEEALKEIERDPRGAQAEKQTARLTAEDLDAIKHIVTVHYEDGRD